MSAKVTLSDIAKELGLSIPTVHRSINNIGRVSEKTRQLVLRKASEMGYRTNMAASMLSSKKQTDVAIICPNTFFYEDILAGFRNFASQFPSYGINVKYIFSRAFDAVEQTRILEELLKSDTHYSVVAIPAAHPVILNPLISRLSEAGTLVLTFDNDAPTSDRKLFIGPNGYVSGQLCAQLYSSILHKGARVAILPSFVTAIGLKERVNGFSSGCESIGKLNSIGVFEYNDYETEAYYVCRQIIETMKPDAIYTNSMMGSLGCARAIQETNNSKNIFMIGYDFNDQIKSYIENDIIYGSLYQQPFAQGAKLAESIMQFCTGIFSPLPQNTNINTILILKSNTHEFTTSLSK